ncbi:MAG: pseudouridine-5'-phosphate glycosidase [Gemmataceae bacterium]|nr:pseudouridine-5'-phosphate glycosidase [Gemmataceae bacterium]
MRHELRIRSEVRDALATGIPVVALESTLIAHGLPYPANVETARASETAVREHGAVPATIAVLAGVPTVGLADDELESLATEAGIRKASRRDLGPTLALRRTAATTVSATMALAHAAGIRVFATGGIGGVHKGPVGATFSWDVSADLVELGRTPVAVVCAGAKSLLDLPNTLEYLETLGVPVVGFGCDEFPAFYLTGSRLPAPARVDEPAEAAELLEAHWQLGGAGAVIAQPPPAAFALDPDEFHGWLAEAERLAAGAGVSGPAVTPFVLKQLAGLSGGRTVKLNQELIVANAGLAARISVALASTR